MVKNPHVMRETWVRSIGWEDPQEKGTATYSSSLAWRIPWTEEFGRLQSMGSQKVGHDWATFTFTFNTKVCLHTIERKWTLGFISFLSDSGMLSPSSFLSVYLSISTYADTLPVILSMINTVGHLFKGWKTDFIQ